VKTKSNHIGKSSFQMYELMEGGFRKVSANPELVGHAMLLGLDTNDKWRRLEGTMQN